MSASQDYLAALRLTREGQSWPDACTLVALRHGLHPVRQGWTLRELGDLLFFRDLYQRHPERLGIPPPDGTCMPIAVATSPSVGSWIARLRGHGL